MKVERQSHNLKNNFQLINYNSAFKSLQDPKLSFSPFYHQERFTSNSTKYNIHTLSNKHVMRILKLIRQRLLSFSNTKFSQLIYKEMCCSWREELNVTIRSCKLKASCRCHLGTINNRKFFVAKKDSLSKRVLHHDAQQICTYICHQLHKLLILTWVEVCLHLFQHVS